MIVNINVILLVEKTKKKNERTGCNHEQEISKVFPIQEGNHGELVEASSILSEIGRKNVEIPNEVMTKPLIPIMEEVETQLIGEEGMQNVLTHVDMEKERVQEVVNKKVIIDRKDHKFQYLKNEDVEIIVVKKPFHQQLEKELLM